MVNYDAWRAAGVLPRGESREPGAGSREPGEEEEGALGLYQARKEETVEEVEKAQALRVWDVLFLGPLLIAAGARVSTLPRWMRAALATSGGAVIAWNGRNWLVNERLRRRRGGR